MVRSFNFAGTLSVLAIWMLTPGYPERVQGQDRVPGFLAPIAESISADSLPLNWDPSSPDWQVEIPGYGQSAPVVWDNRIYLTSVSGAQKETYQLSCFELLSGRELWSQSTVASHLQESSAMVSRAAPTPVVDEAGVYVFYESGQLVAFTHEGQPRWSRSLQNEYGMFENKFGISASLSQTEEAIYVLVDHRGPSYLMAIAKADGGNLWRVERGTREHSWSSPGIVRLVDREVVVCSSVGTVDVYDAKTGEHLIADDRVGGNSVATPVDLGEGRFLVASLIRPADGPVEGALTSNLLAKIVYDDAGYRLQIAWIADQARGSFCSPVAHDGYCYWINPTGVLYCLEMETGTQVYSKRLPCGGCWATPLAIEDRLYCFGRSGEVSVVRCGPEFEILSDSNRLWLAEEEATTQTLYAAVAGHQFLLIRRGDRLYRLSSSAPAS